MKDPLQRIEELEVQLDESRVILTFATKLLNDERAFCDRVVEELNKHGWGDMHYGDESQDREIVKLVKTWELMRGRKMDD